MEPRNSRRDAMWIDFKAEVPKPKEVHQVISYFKRKAKARFYADENFPEQAINLLRAMGAKVQTSYQAGLSGRPDQDQLAYALRNGLVLVTCDRDFLDDGSQARLIFTHHPQRKLHEVHYARCVAMPSGRCLPSGFGI